MSYYEDVYLKRLNRYGHDYQSRVQKQRERNFDDYLLKSLYRVDCKYDDNNDQEIPFPATLERYKQDYTETQGYLLTRLSEKIDNGTILTVISRDGLKQLWMVWWLEQIEMSGYNKYVVLKMTDCLTWSNGSNSYSQYGYFSGPGTTAISDTIKTASNASLYRENQNLHMFITPYTDTLYRDSYIEIQFKNTKTAFVVTDIDVLSTAGVMYVSVDPTYIRDNSINTAPNTDQTGEKFFWLNGGK